MTQFYIKDGEEYKVAEGFTQDEVNEVVGKRLERERAKYSDYEALKSQTDDFAVKTKEFEDTIAQITAEKDDLAKQLKQANLNTEKTKLLREFNISDDLAEFVTGNDVEEMRTRAEKLSKSTAKAITVEKVQKPEPKHSDFDNIAKTLLGSNTKE